MCDAGHEFAYDIDPDAGDARAGLAPDFHHASLRHAENGHQARRRSPAPRIGSGILVDVRRAMRGLAETRRRLEAAQLRNQSLLFRQAAIVGAVYAHSAELARESRAHRQGTAGQRPMGQRVVEEVHVDSLVLLPRRTAVQGSGGVVALTAAEWSLLLTLVEHRDEVLERADMATQAWGPQFAARHNEVEVYVSRLRRKLREVGATVRIETVRGRGYRLSSPSDELPSAEDVPLGHRLSAHAAGRPRILGLLPSTEARETPPCSWLAAAVVRPR